MVELIIGKGFIIPKPQQIPRHDWEKAFKKMNDRVEDKLLLDDVFEDENFEEWN